MAISTVPVVSEQVVLADVSAGVKKLEKGPKGERAWIQVRQATEQDSMTLEASLPDTKYEYIDDVGPDGRPVRRTVETRSDRVRDRFAMQVWMCLCGTGNIDRKPGEALFKFKDKGDYMSYDGSFEEFLKDFGLLPSTVALAMRDVVYDHNPHWDWRVTSTVTEGEESAETK